MEEAKKVTYITRLTPVDLSPFLKSSKISIKWDDFQIETDREIFQFMDEETMLKYVKMIKAEIRKLKGKYGE
jgi:hypothetical protein